MEGMVGEETLQSLLDVSEELEAPLNSRLDHQGTASWLFVYSGPRATRNGHLRDLQPLGPFEPFQGSSQSTMDDLLSQSVRARRPVLAASDQGPRGTLVIGFSGDAERAVDYVAKADTATHGVALSIHGQVVNVKTDIEPGP